jgi:CheY-like chemotaxis protein
MSKYETGKDNVMLYSIRAFNLTFLLSDLILRKLFSRAIRKVAPTWKIQEAASGEAALSMVDSSDVGFDVIFIDQYMASTEKQLLGTESVRSLRSKCVKCKICGLSANNLEDSVLSAGADFFMPKPIPCDPKELK